MRARLLVLLAAVAIAGAARSPHPPGLASEPQAPEESPGEGFKPRTRVSLDGINWQINGEVTYPGAPAKGLLMNVRMANAAFDDRNPETRPRDLDPDRNTRAFIDSIPRYLESGVRAFSVFLQGGDPGYKGALCSAFEPDGGLRPADMARIARIIEACDRAGAVVILGLFNRWQDQVLRDRSAIEAGVQNAARWVKERGYTNVILEIADEVLAEGYDHAVFNDPVAVGKLIEVARKAAPGLLVGANRKGTARIETPIGAAADYLSTHFTGLPVDDIAMRVVRVSTFFKPIICIADLRAGEEGAAAAEAAVQALCSWGFSCPANERYPFRYEGEKDDPAVYARLKELTGR